MKTYIEENKQRFFDELFSLLRIPSISAKAAHKPDMRRCAERLAVLLVEAGADEAQVLSTDGNPVVVGSKIIDPKAKTVLIYGHYDVQPPEPLELWRTDPFEPVIGPDPATGAYHITPEAFAAEAASEEADRAEDTEADFGF